ncbi:MAG: hypothetical protein C0518_10810 [Opitutus sp.]|nr:hypothetical protein [Opitutus sp.]
MGQPDEQRDETNPARGQAVWIYKGYSPSHEPRERTGWSEVLSPGVRDQHGNVVRKPLFREVYRPQRADDIQVIFLDGAVWAVERQGN